MRLRLVMACLAAVAWTIAGMPATQAGTTGPQCSGTGIAWDSCAVDTNNVQWRH